MAMTMCMIVVSVLATAAENAQRTSAAAAGAKTLGKKTMHTLMMKDPVAMLTEIEEMAGSGETPAFDLVAMIISIIQDEAMPDLNSTRYAAAQRTTDALNAIQQ